MNIEHASNMKSVAEFVTYIRDRLQNANRNWWEIALAFAEAREMYGTESGRFKSLCSETGFGISKATKLAKIAESDRLQAYSEKLSAVHSWGTLYAITTLDSEKFEELKKVFKLDEDTDVVPFITQQAVEKIRKGPAEKSFLKNYAVIQLDEDALKGGLLDGGDLAELYRLIAKIDNLSSYIRVKHTEVDEKNNLFWLNRIEDKASQLARKALSEAVSARISSRKKASWEKQEMFEIKCLGMSRRELFQMFNETPEEAFKYFGIEYDYASYHRQAEKDIGSKQDKYAERAMNHPKVEPLTMPISEEEEWDLLKQHVAERNQPVNQNLLHEKVAGFK